jgi:ice-binding like protein/Big-like domain-containing protein
MNKCIGLSKIWFLGLLLVAFVAGCAENGGDPGTLVSIKVTPATASIPINGIQQFAALATYGDGSSREVTASSTWASVDVVGTVVATLSTPGLATGKALGTSTITATFGGKTASATLTVSPKTLQSLSVGPLTASIPANGTQQFAAIATWSDQTSSDVTTEVAGIGTLGTSWTLANVPIGVATLAADGATGGRATGKVVGTSTITASYTINGITKTASATLTVSPKTLQSLSVGPLTASTPVNGTRQFVAMAIWSDQTSSEVTTAVAGIGTLGTSWTLANVPTGVATLAADGATGGRATGKVVGTSTITASYTINGITKTASATLTVTAATIRPTVTSTTPVKTTPIPTVQTNTAIDATFDKAMNFTTINSSSPGALSTFTLNDNTLGSIVLGTVTMNLTNTTATFKPTAAALNPATNYTARITTAAKDTTGNALANDYVWSFTTAVVTPPSGLLDLMSYGIASAGGITNIGATKINGNVVLDPTATCNGEPILFAAGPGFGLCGGNLSNVPTVNAGDQVITPTFPDTTTAHTVTAALNVKWNSISPSLRPKTADLGCGFIGSTGDAGVGIGCSGNATLPPGTYLSLTGSTIGVAGVLTLSGGPTDEWFFQAPTALNVEVGSQIILTGGAKASNVWWFVGSDATLKTNSIFQGNILASRTIAMQVGATSCGRLLAGAEGAGAFTFLGNTVSVPGHPNAPTCQ